jgi:ribosome modulation factor
VPALKPPSKAALAKLANGKVRVDGYNTGLAGGARDANPHAAGSEEYATWDKAWAEGAEDLAAKPKKDGGAKAPTENRRSRKSRTEAPQTQLEKDEAAYRASGLTMEQFAKQEGINRLTLAKWT